LGDDGRRQYYIRSGSRSIIAQGINQTRLVELTAKVPFDDRINQNVQLNDLDLGLIREFLQEVGSNLFDESTSMPFTDLCKVMQIARGAEEALRPINAGLLFFNKDPHRFFQRSWIELAVHKDNSGRNFTSKIFTGPLHKQIRECMSFLENEIFKTELTKVTGKAESISVSNYPYNAVEEALSNAIYHKSYSEGKPIEIQVLPDRMEILSYPGPLPPVTNNDLQQRRVIARDYRNRRIGDFLKELKLTEGKATGIPLIRDEMAKNGNPGPVFFTDEDRTLFQVTLPCHPDFIVTKFLNKVDSNFVDEILAKDIDFKVLGNLLDNDLREVKNYLREQLVTKLVTKQVTKSLKNIVELIDFLKTEKSRNEMLSFLEIGNQTKNFDTNIRPLLENGIIEMTIPGKPRSRHQKYRLTLKGEQLLK